jgi:hypothetical protein
LNAVVKAAFWRVKPGLRGIWVVLVFVTVDLKQRFELVLVIFPEVYFGATEAATGADTAVANG